MGGSAEGNEEFSGERGRECAEGSELRGELCTEGNERKGMRTERRNAGWDGNGKGMGGIY